MSIGERIRYFRIRMGLTQKALGILVGFPDKTARIRISQYETGGVLPSQELGSKLENIFQISSLALNVPNIDTAEGILHTLFALEDIGGFKISEIDGEFCLEVSQADNPALYSMLKDWAQQASRMQEHIITRDEYDRWRYNFSLNTSDAYE